MTDKQKLKLTIKGLKVFADFRKWKSIEEASHSQGIMWTAWNDDNDPQIYAQSILDQIEDEI